MDDAAAWLYVLNTWDTVLATATLVIAAVVYLWCDTHELHPYLE